MRIHLKSGDQNIRLVFPTGLIFSKAVAWLGVRYGLRYAGDSMKIISAKQLDALFAEFRRIKRKHGSWVLVDVESSGGDLVKIIL